MGEWTSGLLIRFATYGYCGHELAGVLLMYVGFEVLNGCGMGVKIKILECQKGWYVQYVLEK